MNEDDRSAPRHLSRVAKTGRRLNEDPHLLTALRRLRGLLPGDSRFGDALSLGVDKRLDLVGRRIAELTAERPGVLREAGLSALQVWQALSEARGRGRGDEELAIVFTDLVEFSSWAIEAGDEVAEQAGGGELLASDRVIAALEDDTMSVRRKRLFRAKGVPKEVTVYAIEPAD